MLIKQPKNKTFFQKMFFLKRLWKKKYFFIHITKKFASVVLPWITVETFFCCISRIICHVWLHFGRINFQKQQKQPAKYYHLIIAPLTCFHYDGFGLKETSTSQNIANVANAFDFYICSVSPFSIFPSRPDKDRIGINKATMIHAKFPWTIFKVCMNHSCFIYPNPVLV